mmetsp:Transcript_20244/g.46879  ORF Transcript_20244/g.46879 Transcript_20244/m.46879 type:complete len:185 (+) Transcript_20244:729-1283(+)
MGYDRPRGDRWAVAKVDLSGNWKLVETDEFKVEYEEYLRRLGKIALFRSIALSFIGWTTEETRQSNEGRSLHIVGKNPRGVWERTLLASGATTGESDFTPLRHATVTGENEPVEAESWWEQGGTVHRSWMRGVTKYGGGDFESVRYLEQNGKVYVCESTFHHAQEGLEDARVTFRFLREGSSID